MTLLQRRYEGADKNMAESQSARQTNDSAETRRRGFSKIPLLARSMKPRRTGLTMMIDWGLGLGAQADYLEVAGEFVDLAKIAVGISGLLPLPLLKQKISLYKQHAVEPFPGGGFLEYAVSIGQVDQYLRHCMEAGYCVVEVSENFEPLPHEEKTALIKRAREDFGMRVLGETGSKSDKTTAAEMVSDIDRCLGAGADLVLVEALELYDKGVQRDILAPLLEEAPADRILIEIPGAWTPGINAYDRYELILQLISAVGPDVGLANIEASEVLFVESLRRKYGVAGYK